MVILRDKSCSMTSCKPSVMLPIIKAALTMWQVLDLFIPKLFLITPHDIVSISPNVQMTNLRGGALCLR